MISCCRSSRCTMGCCNMYCDFSHHLLSSRVHTYKISSNACLHMAMITMRGIGDDEQLFVLGTGIRSYHGLVALCLAVHHVMIRCFAEITAVGVRAVHDQNGRTDLVDVVQETAVGISLRADDTPTVIRVTAAPSSLHVRTFVTACRPSSLRHVFTQGHKRRRSA